MRQSSLARFGILTSSKTKTEESAAAETDKQAQDVKN